MNAKPQPARQVILISGARAPIALELARSFAQHGHRVVVCDSLRLTIARWSNSVARYYVTPSPKADSRRYVEVLQNIIEREKITHFIPTCEDAVFVAQHRAALPCKVWTCSGELILQLHNKLTFTKLGLPTPETQLVSAFGDWHRSEAFVFKPVYSRFASAVLINKRLTPDYFPPSERDRWIAQRKIDGKEICVYSIWDGGWLKGYRAYHPVYRAGKGAGVFFEPVNDSAIFQLVQQFGESLAYTGQLCFDVILEVQTQQPYFIECNPRGTSGAHLLNRHLATSFLGSEAVPMQTDQEYAIKYAMAILHPRTFWSKRVRQAQDVIFQWRDPLPFFLQILSLLEITYIKFRRGVSWLEATTGDIEWNGD